MTKLRVIFVEGKNVSKGSRAIRQLCQSVRKKVLDVAWPVGFESFTTERKLTFLGSILPEKAKLILIREMKHTRKNRSKYVDTLTHLLENNPQDQLTNGDIFVVNNEPQEGPVFTPVETTDWRNFNPPRAFIPPTITVPNGNVQPAETPAQTRRLNFDQRRVMQQARNLARPPQQRFPREGA